MKHFMEQDGARRMRKQLLVGVMLIVAGTVVLLDRVNLLDLDLDLASIWHYWPWLLVVLGINNMLPPTSPRYFLNGLWKVFFAGWWYVSYEHVWGLDFSQTWPALLVAWGTGMVLQPTLTNYFVQGE
ncbi:LiaF transmembrane domain-containing protein [Rugamonas brunnea]|nr:DUF5668 domain-containing protein [Rugamonas brunnea]